LSKSAEATINQKSVQNIQKNKGCCFSSKQIKPRSTKAQGQISFNLMAVQTRFYGRLRLREVGDLTYKVRGVTTAYNVLGTVFLFFGDCFIV